MSISAVKAARLLGLTRQAVYYAVRRGDLRILADGGIDMQSVRAYKKKRNPKLGRPRKE